MNHAGFYYLNFKFNTPILYINGNKVKVSENCFHACVLYAREKQTDKVFNDNFANSLLKLMPREFNSIKLQQIDFSKLTNYKIDCESIPSHFGFVKISGKKYKLSNYIVEPLHIFKGRGTHPLRGTIKPPVSPEQITINAANNPPCLIHGSSWGNVINNSSLQWAGFYKDSLGQSKYMYPCLNDEFSKFETARKLHKKLHSIRKQYTKDLYSESLNTKQKATATYFIDKLCIRVGHPKEGDCADTVGCCTLRLEHIKLNGQSLSLCFFGKDSIEFKKTIVPSDIVLSNVKDFIKNKKANDLLFCKIDASVLNTYLNKLQKGLTAKQFRTCHASSKFDNLLKSYNPAIDGNIVKYFKASNSKVAKLCNHKKGNLLSNETSKANYIDPRITYAFCKRNNINVSLFFSPLLLEKHSWANNTPSDFKF
jgi:DNA topoisomerase-1